MTEQALLEILADRFATHASRHPDLRWDEVKRRLQSQPEKLTTIAEMEQTGGEPDVVVLPGFADEVLIVDCSPESPSGRRSLCYDRAAWEGRKANKPAGSAVELAAAIGIELLTEDQYRALQQLDKFDLKTSSWVKTPEAIRSHGGAIFCDRRYDHVFTYHNGADSYYAARGFRGLLRLR